MKGSKGGKRGRNKMRNERKDEAKRKDEGSAWDKRKQNVKALWQQRLIGVKAKGD